MRRNRHRHRLGHGPQAVHGGRERMDERVFSPNRGQPRVVLGDSGGVPAVGPDGNMRWRSGHDAGFLSDPIPWNWDVGAWKKGPPADWIPERGEVILMDCSCDFHDQKCIVNPFVVFSPREFNDRTSQVIGLSVLDAYTPRGPQDTSSLVQRVAASKEGCIIPPKLKIYRWRSRGATPYPRRSIPEVLLAGVCGVLQQIFRSAARPLPCADPAGQILGAATRGGFGVPFL